LTFTFLSAGTKRRSASDVVSTFKLEETLIVRRYEFQFKFVGFRIYVITGVIGYDNRR